MRNHGALGSTTQRLLGLVVSMAVIAGCMSGPVCPGDARCPPPLPPLTCPEHGGAPWRLITTRHFLTWTDSDEEAARALVAELEQIETVLRDVAFPGAPEAKERTHVVSFSRAADYAALGPGGSVGAFTSEMVPDIEPHPTILLRGTLDAKSRATLRHELAHAFMRRSRSYFAPWLGEGFAEYYESLTVADGVLTLGAPLSDLGFTWRSRKDAASFKGHRVPLLSVDALPRVSDLVALGTGAFYAARSDGATADDKERQRENYGGAWVLVHLLTHDAGLSPRFDRYLAAIDEGATNEVAWKQCFGEVADEVEQAYRDHAARLLMETLQAPYELPPPAPVEASRVLSDAEIHRLWARLWLSFRGESDKARAELAKAVSLDPSSTESLYWQGVWGLRDSAIDVETTFQRALSQRPDDPAILLGAHWAAKQAARMEQLGGTPEGEREARAREDDLFARLAKVATTATQQGHVAWNFVLKREPDRGLPHVRAAMAMDPTSSDVMDTYAALLFQKRAFQQAAEVEEQAVALMSETDRRRTLPRRRDCMLAAASHARGQGAPPLEPCDRLDAEVLADAARWFARCERGNVATAEIRLRYSVRADGSVADVEDVTPESAQRFPSERLSCMVSGFKRLRFPPYPRSEVARPFGVRFVH